MLNPGEPLPARAPRAGDGLRRREHWPLWFLVGAVFFGLSALTSRAAAHRVAGARLAQAAVSAGLVGAYLALDFFPGVPLLQARALPLLGRLACCSCGPAWLHACCGAEGRMPFLAARSWPSA